MRLIAYAIALALAGTAAVAAPAPVRVRDVSSVDPAGGRTLEFSTIVAAPPAAVWQALTDAATYRKWAAPVAFIDLRVGGMLEAGYDPAAKRGDANNVKQEIVAYLPARMIAFRNIQAAVVPSAATYAKLAIVITLRDLGDGRTEVSLADVGFRDGADYDALYTFFKAHNPQYLAGLAAFFADAQGTHP